MNRSSNAAPFLSVRDLPGGGILLRVLVADLQSKPIVRRFRRELTAHVAHERLMLVDLTCVKAISSTALGVLLAVAARQRRLQGEIRLCGLHDNVARAFHICRLESVFPIYRDLESALAADGVPDV